MKIPESIEKIILEFDNEQKPIHWNDLQNALAKARAALGENLDENLKAGTWSDVAAWSFQSETRQPWQTYFGPMFTYFSKEGHPLCSPDIKDLTAEIIAHWASRAELAKHPQIKARYSDLAWDLAPHVNGAKRDCKWALSASDAYIESFKKGLLDFYDEVIYVSRALQLACSVNNEERRNIARDAMLSLHERAVDGEGLWWKTFDNLTQKQVRLTDAQKKHLLSTLESLSKKFGDPDSKTFNPHHLQSIAERLQPLYQKDRRLESAIEVQKMVGNAFEKMAGKRGALAAITFLQISENAYRSIGLADDAKRVRTERAHAIRKAREEMTPITITQEISSDDMEQFLSAVIADEIVPTLARIATRFVWRISELEKIVADVAKAAPLNAIMPISVLATDHETATIGSVEDDLDGRICQQAIQTVPIDSVFLNEALDTAIKKFDLDPHELTSFVSRSELFDDLTFILEGVAAWFDKDYFKTVFLLVPQIERGMRELTRSLGEPVTKKHPTMAGREVSIGLGDILGNAAVKKALGADLTLYFRAIYSDPRGFNLRNQIAHGLAEPKMINSIVANISIHTLVVMALWKEIAAHRKPKLADK